MTNTYKTTDCGAMGKTTEKAIKEFFGYKVKVSAVGKTDVRRHNTCIEVKTCAGELGNVGEKLLKGCSKVIYIPVVNPVLPIERQEGFFLSRDTFLEVLNTCGLIREKTATDGSRKVTIQTFWNNSKNAPTSRKKYEMLVSELYDNCEMTLEEYLAE